MSPLQIRVGQPLSSDPVHCETDHMEATADETVRSAIAYARSALVEPGDWLTGRQRRAAWLECRDARGNELDQARKAAVSPNAVQGSHAANDHLSAAAVEVLHRVTTDPGRLTRAWANEVMSTLGDAMYTELVGIAATVASVDAFDHAIGDGEAPVAAAVDGDPARERPANVGDIGAWVPQSTEGANANVSRTLSLVPVTDQAWRMIVNGLYSRGSEFVNLTWDRALNRPQVELVAARTTAELECFY